MCVCVLVLRILCSQFPPAITEKLLLVGANGVDLNRKSILEGKLSLLSHNCTLHNGLFKVFLSDSQTT